MTATATRADRVGAWSYDVSLRRRGPVRIHLGHATATACPKTASGAPANSPPIAGIPLRGERFVVEIDGGEIYVRHPRWSLIGSGPTMRDAVRDLISEAHELRHVLERQPEGTLSADAQALQRFLLRI